jgi:hypothetical protein
MDRRSAQHALLAGDIGRLQGADAPAGRLAPGRCDVVDGEGDVVHPVAVAADVLGQLPGVEIGAVKTKRMSFCTIT